MDFPLSRQIAPNLTFVAETGSTNADLIQNSANTDDFSVLVAGFQTAGRGRAGRDWVAPSGSSLFVSVLLKPAGVAATNFSWLPLLAGLAMTKTVAKFLPEREVGLKWPNDVLVGEKKISGVLSELIGDQSGVVIGAGLNLLQQQTDLPIDNATSLAIEGATSINLDEVLSGYLANLRELYLEWVQASGNAVASGLRNQVIQACSTLDRSGNNRVRVILPASASAESEIVGAAVGIDDTGRLIVQPDGQSEALAVAAGDIVHLRHN
ncbi:MAG: biotin--[acetyl-CoA-carboxylase] ligase [Rhodoluna sp.]|jgi:BirA family biotin operon repressor/biotin-[acetyl-CoA-carboxylase] ligase|nr:biotin--[acetyl-CoA-carboxylase] ligase [Rhodoluna sp.]